MFPVTQHLLVFTIISVLPLTRAQSTTLGATSAASSNTSNGSFTTTTSTTSVANSNRSDGNFTTTTTTIVPSTTKPVPAIFYPFGLAAGHTENPTGEETYYLVNISSPFLFFGRTFSQIYVNGNGFLSFKQPLYELESFVFPAAGSEDLIAPLYTDIDDYQSGVVSYHEYTNGSVLTRASQDINQYFPHHGFNVSWVFVATWNYGIYGGAKSLFQVVLISGSNLSFILMNYGDMAAAQSEVQAGYNTANSEHYFVIPHSNELNYLPNLKYSSNVDVPGRWFFGVSNEILVGLRMTVRSFSDLTQTGNIETVLKQLKQELINRGVSETIALKLRASTNKHKRSTNKRDYFADVLRWVGGQLHAAKGHSTFCLCLWLCPTSYQRMLSVSQHLLVFTTSVLLLSMMTKAQTGTFYPFGLVAGDTDRFAIEDENSTLIDLWSPFAFFGRIHHKIYVNNNGYLTFNQSSSEYIPKPFPANGSKDIIAPLWTDIDVSQNGVISYQQYSNGSVLTRASQDINQYFPDLSFHATWVFVATWDKVEYFYHSGTETSFQAVLISDGNLSFILMNYGDVAVTQNVVLVQAGYDTVNSTHYCVIPGSDSGSYIPNLKNSSNVNVPGCWAFRVDSEPENQYISKENVIGLQIRLSSFLDLTETGNIATVLEKLKQQLIDHGLPNTLALNLRRVQKKNL
ncbi:uncharacterized protein LOC127423221 [Myxocyprinus asiaticus]|uniref:uncharacterized protein LOC127423221 n=1 Tax=Myxocyprinus asiaticus TaxID=70543 RepID=UPI002221C7C2|nr:uncharacterized protein LOC127423221 [Myxocyprinus asiaticus]